jgi:UDP-glucose 4-epimerase/UDP-glucuronate 4-epimerase
MSREVRNVLVTGIAGFIGLPVARRLLGQGTAVVGLDLVRPEIDLPGADMVIGDFADPDVAAGIVERYRIDTIVHAGAISGPMLARDQPYLVSRTNVVGTLALLESARVHRVQRFVYCSSAMAFGDTPPPPVPDDAPLGATDLYGSTKGASDLLLRAYRKQYSLGAVSLRISNGYGPRRRTRCAIRTMIENALEGTPTYMSWGGGYGRAYLFVDDAVSAIVAAACAERVPQWAYNVAGERFTLMEEVADVVRSLIPGSIITRRPGVDELGYRREALDISAAKRDLAWHPEYSIERGVATYLEWIKAHRAQERGVE